MRSATAPAVAAPKKPATAPVAADDITVYFSPRGGATAAVIAEMAQAKDTIQIQAYQFTSAEIAKALLDAHKRGVKVVVVLDPTQEAERYHVARFLYNAGIPAYIDRKHNLAHNKVMVIDGTTVITGSFNFTKAAEQSNAENLLVIKDHPAVAAAYVQNFDRHLQHSQRYDGPRPTDTRPRGNAKKDGPPSSVPPATVPSQAAPRRDGDVYEDRPKLPF